MFFYLKNYIPIITITKLKVISVLCAEAWKKSLQKNKVNLKNKIYDN